jgi:hypothetical protein
MQSNNSEEPLFVAPPAHEGEGLLAAVERGLRAPRRPLADLPALSDLALRDPYLAGELAALRERWELRPAPASGPIARLRARLAWRLLGPELQQINQAHASLVRLVDSLVAHLDDERVARARLEARLAALERAP